MKRCFDNCACFVLAFLLMAVWGCYTRNAAMSQDVSIEEAVAYSDGWVRLSVKIANNTQAPMKLLSAYMCIPELDVRFFLGSGRELCVYESGLNAFNESAVRLIGIERGCFYMYTTSYYIGTDSNEGELFVSVRSPSCRDVVISRKVITSSSKVAGRAKGLSPLRRMSDEEIDSIKSALERGEHILRFKQFRKTKGSGFSV